MAPLLHFRLLLTRLLKPLHPAARLSPSGGSGETPFLILLAILTGLVASVAALAFHTLIEHLRDRLFHHHDPNFLYGYTGLPLLILIPAAGGLAVGLAKLLLFRKPKGAGEGHGVVDVIESVLRARSFARPHSAFETLSLSGITLGTGGSAGAEGPIVQIGAALASGVSRLFSLPPNTTALLVASGAAAGIAAIFNAPLGGILFALELILIDFSVRSLTPVVVAAVVANVSTQSLYRLVLGEDYRAIFALPPFTQFNIPTLSSLWFVALAGLFAGLAGALLTRSMLTAEHHAPRLLSRLPRTFQPALGGALLGVLAIAWVFLARQFTGGLKPFSPTTYPLPAFMGDGYGIIQSLISSDYFSSQPHSKLLAILAVLLLLKILATTLTLVTGGVGGIIAPALFLGATAGALAGLIAKAAGSSLPPELCALAGMAGGLAAVIHAPLASALILVETAGNNQLLLPGMLAVVIALTTSKLLCPDSLYSHALKQRGLRLTTATPRDLHSQTLRNIPLTPAHTLPYNTLASDLLTSDPIPPLICLTNAKGHYAGILTPTDLAPLELSPESNALLTAQDLAQNPPTLSLDDDLLTALETLLTSESNALPVLHHTHLVGTLSRKDLLKILTQK